LTVKSHQGAQNCRSKYSALSENVCNVTRSVNDAKIKRRKHQTPNRSTSNRTSN